MISKAYLAVGGFGNVEIAQLPTVYAFGVDANKMNTMPMISRKIILDTMIKHETLTIIDMTKAENLGLIPEIGQLKYLLSGLVEEGFIIVLQGATPRTYSITKRGIEEGKQLGLE